MKTRLSLLELGLVVGTRAVLAAGVGLLLADRLRQQHRHRVGWTLVAVGALSTLPLARRVLAGVGADEDGARALPGTGRYEAPNADAMRPATGMASVPSAASGSSATSAADARRGI